MEITLQLSDKVYERLMVRGGRAKGSIGLVAPREGNFNEYSHRPRGEHEGSRHIRLRHGKACVNRYKVSLRLDIGRNEEDICPSEAIERESQEASRFVYRALDDWD